LHHEGTKDTKQEELNAEKAKYAKISVREQGHRAEFCHFDRKGEIFLGSFAFADYGCLSSERASEDSKKDFSLRSK
jgi:hypothetical protein